MSRAAALARTRARLGLVRAPLAVPQHLSTVARRYVPLAPVVTSIGGCSTSFFRSLSVPLARIAAPRPVGFRVQAKSDLPSHCLSRLGVFGLAGSESNAVLGVQVCTSSQSIKMIMMLSKKAQPGPLCSSATVAAFRAGTTVACPWEYDTSGPGMRTTPPVAVAKLDPWHCLVTAREAAPGRRTGRLRLRLRPGG